MTKATGIDQVVKAVAGEDCGCDERRDAMNKLFPYAQPMTEEHQELWIKTVKPAWKSGRLAAGEQDAMNRIYAQVYNTKRVRVNCGGCVKTALQKLEQAYEAACDS